MTEKRFQYNVNKNSIEYNKKHFAYCNVEQNKITNKLNKLNDENEQLKQDIENLKITINARETLIDVCEKKFKELGYIITVDDDGYVIE